MHSLAPSSIKIFQYLSYRLLRLHTKNFSWLLKHTLCYLLLIIISHIGFGFDKMPNNILYSIVITSAIFSSCINPFQELNNDFNSGHLQQFMLLGIWRIIPSCSYLSTRLSLSNLSFIAVQPIAFMLLNVESTQFAGLLFASIITISYNLIITFIITCLMLGNPNNLLLTLLSLPLSIPGIIFASLGINHTSYHWLGLSALLVMAPISVWLGEKIMISALSE